LLQFAALQPTGRSSPAKSRRQAFQAHEPRVTHPLLEKGRRLIKSGVDFDRYP
jgi:hypothetical protein